MTTKKTLLLWIIVSLTAYACVDRLTFYHKNYKPQLNSKLRFDGYYAKKEKPFDIAVTRDSNEIWANPITPKFFYQDGSVAYHATHKDEQHLTETFTKYNGGYPNWGIFKTSGDTLTVEVLQGNSGTMRMERITNKFTIKKDTLLLFMSADRKGKAINFADTFYFYPFAYKPDSSTSFIKTKRKFNK